MEFNYAKEKRKFEQQWAAIRKQYEEAGMSRDAIEELHDFDWDWFKSRRRYISHLANLPDGITVADLSRKEWEATEEDIHLRYNMSASKGGTRYRWMEEIEDERLLQKLVLLSDDDLELLTALVFEERTQSEIAQQKNQNQQSISRQFIRIKKFLEKRV